MSHRTSLLVVLYCNLSTGALFLARQKCGPDGGGPVACAQRASESLSLSTKIRDRRRCAHDKHGQHFSLSP